MTSDENKELNCPGVRSWSAGYNGTAKFYLLAHTRPAHSFAEPLNYERTLKSTTYNVTEVISNTTINVIYIASQGSD